MFVLLSCRKHKKSKYLEQGTFLNANFELTLKSAEIDIKLITTITNKMLIEYFLKGIKF